MTTSNTRVEAFQQLADDLAMLLRAIPETYTVEHVAALLDTAMTACDLAHENGQTFKELKTTMLSRLTASNFATDVDNVCDEIEMLQAAETDMSTKKGN
jgi:hypothetical protein